jgi:hypothetical protein
MGVLQLLAPDQSTVLWDFDDATGAANPSTVITDLGNGLDLGTIQPAHSLFSGSQFGAESLGYSHPPVEVTIPLKAWAATDDALWAGLGQLVRFLTSASPEQPIYLKWNDLTEVRYMDIIAALELPQILRGQALGGLASLRKNSMGPVPIRLLRQPWRRGPAVTTSGVTVPNDPATSTKVRVYPVTVTGDLPTPGKIRVEMDTGAVVERVLIAVRPQRNLPAASMADYLSDTGFAQCEATGRGWTVTLGTDTSGSVDASMSPGSGTSAARTTFSTDAGLARRVTLTRTTKMDSLRGIWDVWLRMEQSIATRLGLQMRWSPSTADPPLFIEPEIFTDSVTEGTPASSEPIEVKLGRVYIPPAASASGMRIELWARRLIGSGVLDLDHIWFVPSDTSSTVVVPATSSSAVFEGSSLTTPVSSPAGGTAGVVNGDALVLDTSTDNAGLGPNAGTVLPSGRYRTFFTLFNTDGVSRTASVRVRNVTLGTNIVSLTATVKPDQQKTFGPLEFDADGTTAYQEQVDDPSVGGAIVIIRLRRNYITSIAASEAIRTDPDRFSVELVDSSNNVRHYLGVEGAVPAMLQPGLNHLMFRADEQPIALDPQHKNIRTRVMTVTVSYDPRYAL